MKLYPTGVKAFDANTVKAGTGSINKEDEPAFHSNGMPVITEKPRDVAHLREMVSRFSISARVDNDGVVSVEEGIGNGHYFAKAPYELMWLKENSSDVERRGSITNYSIEFKK